MQFTEMFLAGNLERKKYQEIFKGANRALCGVEGASIPPECTAETARGS